MKELFEKPLIFITNTFVSGLISEWGYEPDDRIEQLCVQTEDSCDLLKELCFDEETYDEAVTEMCSLLRPRVRIWWAYQCLELVIKKVKQQEQNLKLYGEPPSPGEDSLKEIDELTKIDENEFLPPPTMMDGVNLSDKSSYPDPHINNKGEFIFLPAPLQHSPHREKTLFEKQVMKRHEMMNSLSDNVENAIKKFEKKKEADFVKQSGMSSAEFWMSVFEEHNRLNGKNVTPPKMPLEAKLQERFTRAEQIIDEQMTIVDYEIDKMKTKLPKASITASLSSERVERLMRLVMNWIIDPSTENGLACFELAQKCKGDESAAQLLGFATYWSCPDIAQPGSPVPIPPSPALSPKGVFGSLTSARTLLVPEIMPDEFLEDFIRIGIEVAQGTNMWDKRLPLEEVDDPWKGQAGFGRRLAQPEDVVQVELSQNDLIQRTNNQIATAKKKARGFGKRKKLFDPDELSQ